MLLKISAFLLLILLSCNPTPGNEQQAKTMVNKKTIPTTEFENTSAEPYQIELKIQEENGQSYLTTELQISEGSYITSNYAVRMKGRFSIQLENEQFISFKGAIKETPAATEMDDPFDGKKVKILQGATSCKQAINIKTDEDFQTKGKIHFVIEPKCTLEKYKFTLQNISGKLSIASFSLIE